MTVYGVADPVALRPPTFEDSDRLVLLRRVLPAGGNSSLSEPDFVHVQAKQSVFEDVEAYFAGTHTLRRPGKPARVVTVRQVTEGLLPMVGIEPVLGRELAPEDGGPRNTPTTVLVSQSLWAEEFGVSREVIGTSLSLDGRDVRVAGIVPEMPALGNPDIVTALTPDSEAPRTRRYLTVIGRLRDDLAPGALSTELDLLAVQLGEAHPEASAGWGFTTRSVQEGLYGPDGKRLGSLLLGSAFLLLLLACVTVSTLHFVRATEQEAELGVRAALGAGRGRILRQMTTETGLLGLGAGLVAVALVAAALPVLRLLGNSAVPRIGTAVLTWRLAGTGMGLALGAAVASGILPSLHAMRRPALASAPASHPVARERLRDALVVIQVAVSVVILVGAGLMARTITELGTVDVGFRADGLVTVGSAVPGDRTSSTAAWEFAERYERNLAGIPGVLSAGSTIAAPYTGYRPLAWFRPKSEEPVARAVETLSWRGVSPSYFEAMGLAPTAGRIPSDLPRPTEGYSGLVVVDELVAERYWPGQPAVGKVLQWVGDNIFDLEVVGVVRPVRDEFLHQAPTPRVYWIDGPVPLSYVHTILRTEGNGDAMVEAIASELERLDPTAATGTIFLLGDAMRRQTSLQRFATEALLVFATVALALAALGVYAVTALSVRRRRREMGIRLVMGARPGILVRVAIRQGLLLAGAGLMVGIVAAASLSRLVEGTLFRTDPHDPFAFGSVIAVTVVTTVLAGWIPASRVASLAPARVLATD